MATSRAILQLYENVMQYEIAANEVSLKDIKAGVQSMAYVYAPFTSDFQSQDTKFSNFNDPACRCAYLHKYAPLHTYMVQDAMKQILKKVPDHFHKLLVSNSSRFKICSLGGGPGSDVIGVVTALLFAFGPFHSSVTIVDCMKKWEDTVTLLMHELTVRPFASNYSNIWSYNNNCQWNYIECNLLNAMTNEVNKSIAAASMITMVKFVSAAVCMETENMVDKIFRAMKPGALVLFIDNAAGGFSQIIERSGKRNGLVPIFGPLRHVEYESEALKIERFGYMSCFRTKVTIILMQKLLNHQQNRGNLNSLPKITGQNPIFAISPDLLSNKVKVENTVSPRPSEVIKKPPAVRMPQKPVSSLTVDQNRNGINNKSMSNPVGPSIGSNVTGLSAKGITDQNAIWSTSPDMLNFVPSNRGKIENTTIPSHSLEETKKPSASGMPQKPVGSIVGRDRIGINSESKSSLQNPSATATPQTKSIVPNPSKPENRLSNVNQFRTPQLDSGKGSKRNSSSVPFEQRRPIGVVPPKSPTKIRSPTGDRSLRPTSGPSPTVRTYQPVAGEQDRRDPRLIEVNDSPEETGCSCCSIS